MSSDINELLENEWYIVRHSGETPEIAYNSAVYFLTRAKDGPRIQLSRQQYETLKQAAVSRYGEIVLRDLLHSNHDKPIYRGVERSRVNFARFCAFCRRQQVNETRVRHKAKEAMLVFLETELQRLQDGRSQSIINCSYSDLEDYASSLGVVFDNKFQALEKYCLKVA